MTNVDDAMRELRGYQQMFDLYEQIVESRSGLYDPDQPGDKPFDLGDFDDGLDPEHPAPADDLFDPDDFLEPGGWPDEEDPDNERDGHVCELGADCPYGPDGEYVDPEDLVI